MFEDGIISGELHLMVSTFDFDVSTGEAIWSKVLEIYT